MAVKAPVGITDRFCLEEIEMQGTKLSNIKYAVQIDTLGKECYTYDTPRDWIIKVRKDMSELKLNLSDEQICNERSI